MSDFTTLICPRCGEPIGHRLFVRPVDDEHPEHFDCHQQTRRDAAPSGAVLPERRNADSHLTRFPSKTDARGSHRSDFLEGVKGKPFTENRRLSASPAYARFAQELAYYRADAPYLTVEKCAERCRTLSLLLTAALDT
ncbi:MAG: hypothetical protein HY270_06085 [Deltaproteobacteria bacterium]|nr:hypothetical protein [Deltaproteobacteria bacterium]